MFEVRDRNNLDHPRPEIGDSLVNFTDDRLETEIAVAEPRQK
jgi:hypothetical protein